MIREIFYLGIKRTLRRIIGVEIRGISHDGKKVRYRVTARTRMGCLREGTVRVMHVLGRGRSPGVTQIFEKYPVGPGVGLR